MADSTPVGTDEQQTLENLEESGIPESISTKIPEVAYVYISGYIE